jgi:hypothetical protein
VGWWWVKLRENVLGRGLQKSLFDFAIDGRETQIQFALGVHTQALVFFSQYDHVL